MSNCESVVPSERFRCNGEQVEADGYQDVQYTWKYPNIKKRIGEGAFGIVFLVTNEEHHEAVSKFVTFRVDGWMEVTQFIKEVQVQTELSQRGVAFNILDARIFPKSGTKLGLMGMMTMGKGDINLYELFVRLYKVQIPTEDVLYNIFEVLCKGLKRIHDASTLHLDLHSKNVMFIEEEEEKEEHAEHIYGVQHVQVGGMRRTRSNTPITIRVEEKLLGLRFIDFGMSVSTTQNCIEILNNRIQPWISNVYGTTYANIDIIQNMLGHDLLKLIDYTMLIKKMWQLIEKVHNSEEAQRGTKILLNVVLASNRSLSEFYDATRQSTFQTVITQWIGFHEQNTLMPDILYPHKRRKEEGDGFYKIDHFAEEAFTSSDVTRWLTPHLCSLLSSLLVRKTPEEVSIAAQTANSAIELLQRPGHDPPIEYQPPKPNYNLQTSDRINMEMARTEEFGSSLFSNSVSVQRPPEFIKQMYLKYKTQEAFGGIIEHGLSEQELQEMEQNSVMQALVENAKKFIMQHGVEQWIIDALIENSRIFLPVSTDQSGKTQALRNYFDSERKAYKNQIEVRANLIERKALHTLGITQGIENNIVAKDKAVADTLVAFLRDMSRIKQASIWNVFKHRHSGNRQEKLETMFKPAILFIRTKTPRNEDIDSFLQVIRPEVSLLSPSQEHTDQLACSERRLTVVERIATVHIQVSKNPTFDVFLDMVRLLYKAHIHLQCTVGNVNINNFIPFSRSERMKNRLTEYGFANLSLALGMTRLRKQERVEICGNELRIFAAQFNSKRSRNAIIGMYMKQATGTEIPFVTEIVDWVKTQITQQTNFLPEIDIHPYPNFT